LAFWLVNHKQTYRQETDGGYLWSPKAKANAHGAKNISIPLKFEEHPAYWEGSSFYVHRSEQPSCKQSLSCSIKPPADLNKKTPTFLAEGAIQTVESQQLRH
jgi:hypothetical protein